MRLVLSCCRLFLISSSACWAVASLSSVSMHVNSTSMSSRRVGVFSAGSGLGISFLMGVYSM